MALESIVQSLVAPFKWADKQLLVQYSRLGKHAENEGSDKYEIASVFNMGAYMFAGLDAMLSSSQPTMIALVSVPAWGISACNIMEHLVINRHMKIAEQMETKAQAKEYSMERFRETYARARLPTFITGVLGTSAGAKLLYDTATQQHALDINGLCVIGLGIAGTLWASAMYVRDSNPRLIKKDPFWKRMYEWGKDAVESLIPEPVREPIPIPVDRRYRLQ